MAMVLVPAGPADSVVAGLPPQHVGLFGCAASKAMCARQAINFLSLGPRWLPGTQLPNVTFSLKILKFRKFENLTRSLPPNI